MANLAEAIRLEAMKAPTPVTTGGGGSGGGTPGSSAVANTVKQAFQGFLGRDPKAEAIAHYVSTGLTGDALVNAIYDDAIRNGETIKPFADGGFHTGGIRLVGEEGPELEVTGPSRIFNARDTANMLNGNGDEMAKELKALREENQAQARSIVQINLRMVKLLESWNTSGMPETRLEV